MLSSDALKATNGAYLPLQGEMRVPVRLFASPRLALSAAEIAGLQRVAALPDVVQVVALPDLHVKPQLETPSSTATATAGQVVLSLSSPSPGCGMALALTSLGEEDLSPARLDALFAGLARRLPLRRAPRQALVEDIRPVLLAGASAALERFQLPPAFLGAIERGGNALATLGVEAGPEEILAAIPEELLPVAAQEFGSIGRGNHFLELQVVEEVLDPSLAARWGIRLGQVAAMYHADSGRLGSLIGRLYAYRRKNTPRGRLVELRIKTPFHWAQSRSAGEFLRRAGGFFWPRRYTSLEAGSREARQALLALAAATNYAFANRVAILAALGESLGEVWGPEQARPELLYDVTHNSIRQEQVDGRRLWVHRHNASRALPPGHPELAGTPYSATGQPVLLPGTGRVSSYLCVAREGAAASLFSVDHGAGRSAASLARDLPDGNPSTRRYDYRLGFQALLPHQTREGIEEVLSVLARADLAAPVARLRPLAVLKDASR